MIKRAFIVYGRSGCGKSRCIDYLKQYFTDEIKFVQALPQYSLPMYDNMVIEVQTPAINLADLTNFLVDAGYRTKAVNPLDVTQETIDRSALEFFIESIAKPGLISHPPHYTWHPSGVECQTIAQHFPFNLGNVIKYVWRAGRKGEPKDLIVDLYKAKQYLEFEIERLNGRNVK